MAFNLQHTLVSSALTVDTHETPEGTYFTVDTQGEFQVLYPGRFDRLASASVRHRTRIDMPSTDPPLPPGGIDDPGGHTGPHPGGGPTPQHNGVVVTSEGIPLTLTILAPDGQPFTRADVTLADLKKFRDRRGTPVGVWRYMLTGRSKTYVLNADINESVGDPEGAIRLSVFETVASQSAAPLVSSGPLLGARQSFQFDLFRVGEFVADITAISAFHPWNGSMTLLDPDGARVASAPGSQLRCDIPLSALGKSRGARGAVRPWTLEVEPKAMTPGRHSLIATVRSQGRIGTSALRDRVLAMTGPGGSFIDVKGVNAGDKIHVLMTINDVTAAETIDMHGLFDRQLNKLEQPTDLKPFVPFKLYETDRNLSYGLQLDADGIALEGLDISVGPGVGLGGVPCVRLAFKATGSLKVTWHGVTLASATLNHGRAALEAGIRLDPDGTPRVVTWVSDEPFDIDFSAAVIAALVVALGGPLGGITAAVIEEYVEERISEAVADAVKDLFDDPVMAPKILMTIFGAHVTYRRIGFEGDEIVFEHIAPNEPNPAPRRNYWEAIGRSATIEGVGRITFDPPALGDTWAADNLKQKIDHIVVVMMENRSYDHVLGYRAMSGIDDGADGLTAELLDTLNTSVHTIRPLKEAAFAANAAGKKTRIPKGVGHEVEDVAQQLAGRIDGPDGRQINDPAGFADNFFQKKLVGHPLEGCVADTALGYYEADDLPIYAHLAANYSYCDRYYCSHPGPTLPNRMYSLTGDVQHDRLGVPILHNNHGDNFLLSRAETIYDLLTKRGVSWRVYESAPSVTMLRMFARYATNDTDIRPLSRLESDIVSGDLPSFTYVEPAMHHHPQDDDHPDADMWRGQQFIQRVYEALRKNPSVWQKTLLIITYDEHGGLFDHVVPPLADIIGWSELVGGSVGGSLHELETEGGVVGAASPPAGHVAVGGHGSGSMSGGHLTTVGGHMTTLDPPAAVAGGHVQIPYGVRVPTFVVSPWVAPGKGPSVTLDHCSILKTVLARFVGADQGFLSDRVAASHSFESYLTESQARLNVPASPALAELPADARRVGTSAIVTPPLSRQRLRDNVADFHDLSGFVARMIGR